MKITLASANSTIKSWLPLTAFLGNGSADNNSRDQPPLRSELFSADQMKLHGKTLAASHQLSPQHHRERLLRRLTENEGVLIGVRRLLTDAAEAKRQITPAGEWLLDNFYLIEEQVRTAKRHLPKGYSQELPSLLSGASAGLPRVYDIALETISHGDGRVDPESLTSFVAAYQTATALKLGELWAIPIMLRLALIENLRRVGTRVAADRIDRNHADSWADQMTEVAEKDPKSLILVVADMARSNPPMVSSFVAELARRLQGQGPALALPLTWIEQRLSESGMTIEQLVQSENQQQAADQVSVSNTISGLRLLGAMDWREFVETMSVVEQTLREDPGGVYGRMDFATRDRYRHIVEKVAKNSQLPEADVARKAIQLAHDSLARKGAEDRAAHVGFYLVDKGRPQLGRTAHIHPSVSGTFQRLIRRSPFSVYVSVILLVTLLFTASLLAKAYTSGLSGGALTLTGLLSFLSVSQLAVALVNWLATLLATPRALPRMDFSDGIPPELRTLVVVPAMFANVQEVENLFEALEVRFLANQDPNLHFGLLTDFQDAREETLPEDEPVLCLARKRIEELNTKYASPKSGTFFLFHRPRCWNPRERLWMGYERKRGKLAALNSLLRGGALGQAGNRFSLVVGDTAVLSGVKYVITLDTDTQLPRDSARQIVGAMAHPLNRARFDEDKQRVTEGYGILQPRVAVSLPGTNRSRYARLWGTEPGIDPYTRAVSDVYQDLFGEGSFIGKGIYDVDAFERSLNGRFPENRILSHDLLEGCYARSGLLSDVQLYEEYPTRYSADVSRRCRWIRGDWQIARWLLPGVPGPDGRRQNNPLSGLSRWKILDNLRRSLAPAALTLLLVAGWTILLPAWFWTLAGIAILLVPPLLASIQNLLQKPDDVLLGQHVIAWMRSTERHFAQAAFTLVCLPYEAFFSLDAIARTVARTLFTQRRLLEWNPSSDPGLPNHSGLFVFFQSMWIGPGSASLAAIYLAVSKPASLVVAGPVLSLWFAAPAVAWWISLPLARRRARLTVDQTIFLRNLSRKTWAFFETFVSAADHWLPPDNYQEHPAGAIAHRTSPTNMGLALLANLSACDFGYISVAQLIERTTKALRTMRVLERYRGHFYNWYDTQSLKPLLPLYVSTVDSGNLAGHLLTLRAGLMALPDQKIWRPRSFDGFADTLRNLEETAGVACPAQFAQLYRNLESRPTGLASIRLYLEQLAACTTDLAAHLGPHAETKTRWWADALAHQCQGALDEVTLSQIGGVDEVPTLRELAMLELELPAASRRARLRIAAIESLALECGELAAMEYDFLFDKARHLLFIGYNVSERRLDASHYDLLASEARFCCFVAIAQGQLPQESWFALDRPLTTAGGEPILLSWSGSMFEYLMPLLVMPTYENTLLDQTCKAAVRRQIEYGKTCGRPWGISESGYNTIDVHLNYQYRAFGVPGLGLKRGLAEDLVIAPYASALALMVAPEEACLNLQRLAAEGFEGSYGFYEAIDYTPSRMPRGQSAAVVRSFMAHHQSMSFLSLAHLLLDRPMQKRFESDLSFQATTLLLQERIPKVSAFYSRSDEFSFSRTNSIAMEAPVRVFNSPTTPIPEVQLLSNGRYHVMITNAGGGYSRWKDIAVTRWREDTVCDNWGTFCYVRDIKSGEFWSTAYQPTLKQRKTYEVIFSEGRAEFRSGGHVFDMHTEISVSPEDDVELRRVTITNRSRTRRAIDVTSYAEVVLASSAADALHPAFSNLFVHTEIVPERQAILCTRRPRSSDEQAPWMFHLMAVHGGDIGEVSYETDRMRFIGRGNTVANPQAMSGPAALSGSEGSVLDPIVAIRCRMTLDPEQSVTINIVTGVGAGRDACLGLVEKYQDQRLANRVFDLAWTHSQVVLRQLNATEGDAQLYGRLASSVIYANSSLRAEASILIKNRRGQSGLWGYSISGDLPIVLLQIGDPANIDLARQLVQAHAYWRSKGLAADLVIWNEDHGGYRQLLHDQIMGLLAAGVEANMTDRPGGIFIRSGDQISDEDRILIQSVARAIITDSRGSLADQIDGRVAAEVPVPSFVPIRTHRAESANADLTLRDLIFFNGLGGFTRDGLEYVITTSDRQTTPAPWINVLANPHFGTVISESGLAYTWSENAHEFRLTPWSDDPVSDSSGEAFYLRDEDNGYYWSQRRHRDAERARTSAATDSATPCSNIRRVASTRSSRFM